MRIFLSGSNRFENGELQVKEPSSGKYYTLTQKQRLFTEDTYAVSRYIACENVDAMTVPEKFFYVFEFSYMPDGYSLCSFHTDEETGTELIFNHISKFMIGMAKECIINFSKNMKSQSDILKLVKNKDIWYMESEKYFEIIKCELEELKKGNYFFIKGVAVQALKSPTVIETKGEHRIVLTGNDGQSYLGEDVMPVNHYLLWNYKEYLFTPLGFLKIEYLLPSVKLDLLQQLELWYEDTDQNTEDFALEYQVVSRMLLLENAIIINPKYLLLSSVLEDLLDYIPVGKRKEYITAREKHFYLFNDI